MKKTLQALFLLAVIMYTGSINASAVSAGSPEEIQT